MAVQSNIYIMAIASYICSSYVIILLPSVYIKHLNYHITLYSYTSCCTVTISYEFTVDILHMIIVVGSSFLYMVICSIILHVATSHMFA